MDLLTIVQILDSALRLATPLLFACLAGLVSERAGIFDIGLEGKMLMAAFMAASVAFLSGSVWVGLLGGIMASVALSLVHGAASITFRGNQLISGVAINFFAAGITVVVGKTWFGLGGRTPQLEDGARFQALEWPFAESLRDVALVGPIYDELVSGHTILVYVGLATVVLVWWALFRTRFGLRLRAVGENPESVDTAGVSVVRMRYIAVIICGVLCGLAGAHLATGIAAGFVKDMSAGRGFIALAALIFAKWRPGAALLACLLFGLLEAIAIRFQNIDIPTFISLMSMIGFFAALLLSSAQGLKVYAGQLDPGSLKAPFLWLAVTAALFGLVTFVIDSDSGLGALVLPVQFMQALPYILTVIILAGFVGKAIPPRAGGEPYVKER